MFKFTHMMEVENKNMNDPAILNEKLKQEIEGNNGKILSERLDSIEKLLDDGADAEVTTKDGNTLLHFLIEADDFEFAEHVLKNYKINPNSQNKDGDTPLHLIIKNTNDLHIFKNFLVKGASMSIPNNNGKTPMDYLSENKRIKKLYFKYLNVLADCNRQITQEKEKKLIIKERSKENKKQVKLKDSDLRVPEFKKQKPK